MLRWLLSLFFTLILSGCTNLQRLAHIYSDEAPPAQTFQYFDGSSSLYYSFSVGDAAQARTAIFFYGGTGCPSWKSVMPGYVEGLSVDARIFVLNKRFVADRSTGLFECGEDFQRTNLPAQWVADYREFIQAQLRAAQRPLEQVVLVGVSEGAIPAVAIASQMPEVTHLALIGAGGYSMRENLATLKRKGAIWFDVDSGWQKIAADPQSLEKNWYGNSYRWWSAMMDLDPMPALSQLNIPIFIGVGERDESVPVESARYLAERFQQMGKTNLILKVYPGADHRLTRSNHSYRPEYFATLSCLLRSMHCSAAGH